MRRVTALFSSLLLTVSAAPILPTLVLDLVSSAGVTASENTESNLLVPAGAALAAAAPFARTLAGLTGTAVSSVKFVRAGLCCSTEGGALLAGRGVSAGLSLAMAGDRAFFSLAGISVSTAFVATSPDLGIAGAATGDVDVELGAGVTAVLAGAMAAGTVATGVTTAGSGAGVGANDADATCADTAGAGTTGAVVKTAGIAGVAGTAGAAAFTS